MTTNKAMTIVEDDWIAGEDLLTYEMPLDCTSANGVKAAKAFPKRLLKAHEGRIAIRSSAVYQSNGTSNVDHKIDVGCTVCGHPWEAGANNLISNMRGCPKCKAQKDADSAGMTRSPRASKEEKSYATFLRNEKGWTYRRIGVFIGRSDYTIRKWLNPEVNENGRLRCAKWREQNHERSKATIRRWRTEFEHGKASMKAGAHKRRGLQYHAIDVVWLPEHPDADLEGFVSFDCSELITDAADRELWSFEGTEEAVATRSIQQQKLEKISGEKYSLEHLVPLTRGGIHHPMNFANRALALNIQKGNKRLPADDALLCKRLFNIR